MKFQWFEFELIKEMIRIDIKKYVYKSQEIINFELINKQNNTTNQKGSSEPPITNQQMLQRPSFSLLQLVNQMLPYPMITLQPLQPDRPASSYQMSYTRFHQQQLSSHLSQTQKQQLLSQVEQLKQELSKNKSLVKNQQSQYHQKLLLMSLQVERVRTIMKEQGETIEKIKHEWNQLQSVYILKLQQIKISLSNRFENQLKNKSQQSQAITQQVRQLYIQKIASITESYQKQLKKKDYDVVNAQQYNVKLQIAEMKEEELQARVMVLGRENQRLAEELREMKQQMEDVRHRLEEERFNNNNHSIHNHSYKPSHIQQHQQALKANQKLMSQLQLLRQNLKHSSLSLSQQLTKLSLESKSKDQQLQLMRWKYHKLQQELNQFKNRKTTSNTPENNHQQNKKTLFMNNLRQQKEEEPKRDTEERISYQQSLKKLYDLEGKVEQLTQELLKKEGLLEEKYQEIENNTKQINTLKKALLDKDNTIKTLIQQQHQGQQQKDSSLLLVQKDQLIFGLKGQIEQKDSMIQKMQKEMQKLQKKQKQLQTNISSSQESYSSKLKAKDNELKAKQSEIKVKQSELKLKENQLKSKQSQTRNKQAQITRKDHEIKHITQQLKLITEQNNKTKDQLKRKHLELQQVIQQLKITQAQLKNLQQKTRQNIHDSKPPSIREKIGKKKQESIKDPFADPFINIDDNQTVTDNDQKVNPFNSQFSSSKKLQEYQEKIIQLQSIVQSLQLQWGQTEQNQNASYIDQIKELQAKNEESEKMIKQYDEMLNVMAKKGSMQGDQKNKGKGKK